MSAAHDFFAGAWKCYACGRVEVRNMPNPTTYTVGTPVCYCQCQSGIHNIMTPENDDAYVIEEMNGDLWDFCKDRAAPATGEPK